MSVLHDRSIVLGVSGGIAAYKAAGLASLLVQEGARVEVILTEGATRFLQPLTFEALTHRPVHSDPFAGWSNEASGHVTLASNADLFIVAPATANTIARFALGLANDLLSLVALSTPAPILIAPAMEDHMFHHPATQSNLARLRSFGVTFVGPESGRLASGAMGIGRLAEPNTIVESARVLLGGRGALVGKRIVVTAGGTREPIDPVRYIGNRSSGQMGYAIAASAVRQGANVTLVSGPTTLSPPSRVKFVSVETALEMKNAVLDACETADVLIMAAAVADFRVAEVADRKIKKSSMGSTLELALVPNPDIIAGIERPGLLKIGFAAESDDLLENAAGKLASKGLDMIVANSVATIGSPTSEATFLFADGTTVELPRMNKEDLAIEIVEAVSRLSGASIAGS
jgi:phosphopantothenoylcysteine decarboxylase/phosphopantothenate--cysteine ligase